MIEQIKKRNGVTTAFDPQKMGNSVFKAMASTGIGDYSLSAKVTARVPELLEKRFGQDYPRCRGHPGHRGGGADDPGISGGASAYILYQEKGLASGN